MLLHCLRISDTMPHDPTLHSCNRSQASGGCIARLGGPVAAVAAAAETEREGASRALADVVSRALASGEQLGRGDQTCAVRYTTVQYRQLTALHETTPHNTALNYTTRHHAPLQHLV